MTNLNHQYAIRRVDIVHALGTGMVRYLFNTACSGTGV